MNGDMGGGGDAVDGIVEAPGTPVATSAHRPEGNSDAAAPAKAALLQARVAELEARPAYALQGAISCFVQPW